MNERIQVWSCGGGTQSAAIAALICAGNLPAPDIAVIADTGREVSSTWEYFDAILYPKCKAAGVEIMRVLSADYATVDLYSGADGGKLTIPAYTTENGGIGKLPTYCSNEWKVRVIQRFCTEKFPEAKGFDQWLGISRDESHRMRTGHQGKWQYTHPLIDGGRMMSRQDCYAVVRALGWPPPPRSRCFMCPNQGHQEWHDMQENDPEDFRRAVDFEEKIRVRDKNIFLHQSGKPLTELQDDQLSLEEGSCMSGMCFT